MRKSFKKGTLIIRNGIAFLIVFLFFGAVYGDNNLSMKQDETSSSGQVDSAGLSFPFNLSPSFKEENIHNLRSSREYNMASISEIKNGVLVGCDYGFLFILDLLNKKLKIIKKPSKVKVWNPTGVFFNKKNNTLYVANYQGNNILIFRIDNKEKITFIKEIKFPGLISPENVSSTDDGGLIAIADYDASKVFLINKEGQVQWSYPVRSAHGIAIEPDGSAIYALALDSLDGQIFKISKEGKLITKQGIPSYQKQINFFTYPTHCALSPKGELLYIDAHIGGLVSVNKETLLRNKIIGTYGPAFNQINVSYGYTWGENGNIFLSDMYKGRLIEINPDKNEILNVYYYTFPMKEKRVLINDTSFDRNSIYKDNTINTNKEEYMCIPSINVPFHRWIPGYKALINSTDTSIRLDARADYTVFKRKFLRFININSVAINNKIYSIISSPQNEFAILIKEKFALPIYVGKNYWAETSTPKERQNIIKNAENKIREYNSLLKSEKNPLVLLHNIFFKEV